MSRLKKLKESKLSKLLPEGSRQRGGVQLKLPSAEAQRARSFSRAWQPRSANSAGDGAVSFGYAIAARAGVSVLREFLPRRLERILK